MPRYDYRCLSDGLIWEAVRPITNYLGAACPQCGRPGTVYFSSPPAIHEDLAPYIDDGLGVTIRSRAQRRMVMRAKGLEEVGGSGRHLHGARGLSVSAPGVRARAVPKSGGYAKKGTS